MEDRPVFDFSIPRHGLTPFYSTIGRPSIDPEPIIRMLVAGYCFGIRSERPCEEVDLNLATGFVGWNWKAAFPTIRPFQKLGVSLPGR